MSARHFSTSTMRQWRRYLRVGGIGVLAILLITLVYSPKMTTHAAAGAWTTFLGSNGRAGYNGSETAINPSTVAGLKVHWTHNAGNGIRITTEPIVANGMVYWGSWDGIFHVSRLSDGTDAWADNLGTATGSCLQTSYGELSTATVATVSIGGVPTSVVFVGGGNTTLYALNANTGSIIWQTSLGTSAYFLYSATAVYNGDVYIGISSFGDCPLMNGLVVQLNAATGALLNTFTVQVPGCGGSVWGSPAIDEAMGVIYFVTGNHGRNCASQQYTSAMVELNASNLSFVASWQIPKPIGVSDADFGSTPTLFSAMINGVIRSMVGAVDKNGVYYAFDRTNIAAGPLWTARIAAAGNCPECGQGSISSSSFDNTTLYVGGGSTTLVINGVSTSCKGSINALDPATGKFLWQDCLSQAVVAPVTTLPGLVVLGSGKYLLALNATNGAQLFSYKEPGGGKFWGAATDSSGVLYQGNLDGIFTAFGL